MKIISIKYSTATIRKSQLKSATALKKMKMKLKMKRKKVFKTDLMPDHL